MRAPTSLLGASAPTITAMVYGPTGVGKTALSCGSQRLRTLLIDIDLGGLTPLCFQGDEATGVPATARHLVSYYECRSFQDVLDAHAWVQAHPSQVDLVVVDTATELQRMVISQLCQAARIDVPSQREWGIALTMMDDLCRAFKALGKHLIWTAHEVSAEDEYERRTVYRPAFQGQFRDYYARHFSLIMRYVALAQRVKDPVSGQEQRVVTRALQCQVDGRSHAKDRSSSLGMWEVPILDAIWDKITQRVTSAAKPPEEVRDASGTTGDRPDTATAHARSPVPARPDARAQRQPAAAS